MNVLPAWYISYRVRSKLLGNYWKLWNFPFNKDNTLILKYNTIRPKKMVAFFLSTWFLSDAFLRKVIFHKSIKNQESFPPLKLRFSSASSMLFAFLNFVTVFQNICTSFQSSKYWFAAAYIDKKCTYLWIRRPPSHEANQISLARKT